MIASWLWWLAEGAVGAVLGFVEWRASRRPCTICGDRPTDPAAQLCQPCLVWDRGDSFHRMRADVHQEALPD